jgi:hypothetical protein
MRVGGGITKRLSLPLYHLLLKRLGILFIQTRTVNRGGGNLQVNDNVYTLAGVPMQQILILFIF